MYIPFLTSIQSKQQPQPSFLVLGDFSTVLTFLRFFSEFFVMYFNIDSEINEIFFSFLLFISITFFALNMLLLIYLTTFSII
jgi:hypothetical protein